MLEKPQLSPEQAAAMIKEGMTIMIGGFMAVGTPEKIIDAIVLAGTKNLTIIANDTGLIDRGIGKLIMNKQVSKMIASHVGLNPETGRQMARGELEMELVPQGTLVEQGKEKIIIDDKWFLLEKPLHADISLICCSLADRAGNAIFNKTTKNFNPVMATAANIVIAECEDIVPMDQNAADRFNIPGIFIDYLVARGEK
jgi:acetate CoA/acetoacetate CoA-transferase alpha subunit